MRQGGRASSSSRVLGLLVAGVVSAASACGVELVGTDDTADGGMAPDGGSRSDGPDVPDAPLDAGMDTNPSMRCGADVPFGAPTEVPGLGGGTGVNDRSPTLSLDEREILFSSTRDAPMPEAIYRARRPSLASPFDAPTKLIQTDSDVSTHPMLARDGTSLFFSRKPLASSGTADIWLGYRTLPPTDTFDPGQAVSGGVNGSTTDEIAPFLAKDGALWFARNILTTATFEIFRATPGDPSTFDNAQAVPMLSGAGTDASFEGVVLSADMLFAYVAKSATPPAIRNVDIFVTARASVSADFGALRRVPELSSMGDDIPGFLSDDGCRIYFHSTRSGTARLYVAERMP